MMVRTIGRNGTIRAMTDPMYPVQPPQGYQQPLPPWPPYGYTPTWHPRTIEIPVETNHALHAVITLFLCGLWAPVWIIVALCNIGATRTYVTYDYY